MSPDTEAEAERRCRLMTQRNGGENADAPFQSGAGVILRGWFSRGVIHFRGRRFLTAGCRR